jgi:hypothetical protein
MKVYIPRAALILTLVWAGSGWAQTVFKSTMPDGSVVYGTKPAPGAKKVEEIKPKTTDTGVTTVKPGEQKALQENQAKREETEGRQAMIRDAEKALRDAEAAQAAGAEPLPGERIGTAGGASRLTEAYDERQKSLAAAVAAARKQLDAVRGGAR